MALRSLKDITLGQYSPGNSWIHRLDPRTKLFACFMLMIWILLIHEAGLLVFFFFTGLILYRFSKLSILIALKNIRPFVWLFLITLVLHSVFTPGKSLFKIPYTSIMISHEGLSGGLFYTCRILILITVANLLTLTTAPMSLTDAIERFLRPFQKWRIPAHEIAMMMSIAIRFIPILLEEMQRIQKAQESRGARFEGNLVERIKSVLPILIPLFLSAFRRANDLALAMDARCYQGGEGRISYDELNFKKHDLLAMGVILGLGIPVFIL